MLKTMKLYSLPILSGFLIGTSYIPFPPWALFFCLAPLWIFWTRTHSLKQVFWGGWITQFILNLIGFHWIAHTVVAFGQMPWPVGFFVLFIFCSLAHIYYPLAGVLWKITTQKFRLSSTASWLILPLLFALTERLYPFIFFWHLGYPWLWAKFPGYHLAEWIGFFGLNLVTLTVNVCIAILYLSKRRTWRHPAAGAGLTLLLTTQILGFYISSHLLQTDLQLKVLMVQGNIGNLDKLLAEHSNRAAEKAVNVYIKLTREALAQESNVDLIIWPETAFPEMIYESSIGPQRRRLHRLVQEFNIPILTGAYQRGANQKPYNSIVLLDSNKVVDSYQKTMLLAFGEYFPFADTFPQLKKWFPMVSDFGRGQGPATLAMGDLNIGPQICYEGLFDEFSLGQQKQNAHFMVNITNDSWFGRPFEPYQHMYMTLARAIENRRPLIRVTNTGISTVVLASGEVLKLSPIQKEWYGVYEIPIASSPPSTFYANLGERWPWVLVLAMLLVYIGDRIARTRQH